MFNAYRRTVRNTLLALASGLQGRAVGLAPLLAFLALGTFTLAHRAMAQPVSKEPPKAGASGDSLPPHALARLGNVWFDWAPSHDALAWSPDGQTLASAVVQTIDLWHASTGMRRLALKGHGAGIRRLAFSPDGQVLASGGRDGTIGLWQATTGKLLAQWQGHRRELASLAFADDGKSLASVGLDASFAVWEVPTGKELQRFTAKEGGDIFSAAASLDRKILAVSSGDRKVRLWDVATGKELRQLDADQATLPRLPGSEAIVFSPIGKVVAVAARPGSASKFTVEIYEVATGRKLHTFGEQSLPGAVQFSPDGSLLALTSGQAVRLWSVDTGRLLHRMDPSGDQRDCIAFSADGKLLATAGSGIQLWQVATGQQITKPGASSRPLAALTFLPDGKRLGAVQQDLTYHLWEIASGKEIVGLQRKTIHGGGAVALCARRNLLAMVVGRDTVEIWDGATARKLHTMDYEEHGGAGVFFHLAFTDDGQKLAAFTGNNVYLVWDVETGKEVQAIPGQRLMRTFPVVFSPEGDLLTGYTQEQKAPGQETDHIIQLWDVRTGKVAVKLRGHKKMFSSLAFSPNGRLLASCGADATIRLWEVATGQELLQIKPGDEEHEELCVAFSPDGRLLASGSGRGENKETIRLWDVATGNRVGTLDAPQGRVTCLAFSPDGTMLASGGVRDGTVLVWDVKHLTRAARPPAKDLSPKQLDALWADLAAAQGRKAHAAVSSLIGAEAKAVAFLKVRLRPVPEPDSKAVLRLVAQLDAEEFAVREAARKELEKFGAVIDPILRKALEGKPSPEARGRIRALLDTPRQVIQSPEELRIARAIQVLEAVGTPEAREPLASLAKGAPAALSTQWAKAALARLDRRQQGK
jgi:WD40 repeat protein